jgi:hypothetical protein
MDDRVCDPMHAADTGKAGQGESGARLRPRYEGGRPDDLELIEINLPADYGTWALPARPGTGGGAHA